ncbi:MAG: hypothetical protein K8F91_15405, partial [Candidatus Obscuribacterales bacterium]|nr:hypothetical protein [Candidatus Obscuribacterales bacterium]
SLYKAAQKQLLPDLVSCSPRVSANATGMFLLDAAGLSHLGGEGRLCRDLLKLVSMKGYTEAAVGVSDSAFVAEVASCGRRRWLVVSPRGERQFLSPLPIDYLPLDAETKQTMKSLGIDSIGRFTDLAIDEVKERFGVVGEKAYQLAYGLDRRQPSCPILEKSYQCFLDLGGPVESLTDTIFLIKSLLDRLVNQLQVESLCAEEIVVEFYHDGESIEQRPIRMIRPSNDAKFILSVLRLSLEARPIAREFTALALIVSRTADESFKQKTISSLLDAFRPRASGLNSGLIGEFIGEPYANDFALLLARLITRLGEGSVVRPVLNDHYFLELAGSWKALDGKDSLDATTVDHEYIERMLSHSAVVSDMVLKKFEMPVPALVEFRQSRPCSIGFEDVWYTVEEITVPECLSGAWWDQPLRKSYYKALIRSAAPQTDRLLVRLVHDHESSVWYLEGVYD